jgi:hypothetical protein
VGRGPWAVAAYASPTWVSALAVSGRRPFHGHMSKSPREAVAPNAVLRGGPLDGEQRHVDSRAPIGIEVDEVRAVYRPTYRSDEEFETLAVWAFDRTETA